MTAPDFDFGEAATKYLENHPEVNTLRRDLQLQLEEMREAASSDISSGRYMSDKYLSYPPYTLDHIYATERLIVHTLLQAFEAKANAFQETTSGKPYIINRS